MISSKIQTNFFIVGGSVIGLTIAREIALRALGSVTLIDKEQALGLHTSGRNSGVIHLNTVSLGMTCSLAFARFVVESYLLKKGERALLDS